MSIPPIGLQIAALRALPRSVQEFVREFLPRKWRLIIRVDDRRRPTAPCCVRMIASGLEWIPGGHPPAERPASRTDRTHRQRAADASRCGSLQTTGGYARRSRLGSDEKSWQRMCRKFFVTVLAWPGNAAPRSQKSQGPLPGDTRTVFARETVRESGGRCEFHAGIGR